MVTNSTYTTTSTSTTSSNYNYITTTTPLKYDFTQQDWDKLIQDYNSTSTNWTWMYNGETMEEMVQRLIKEQLYVKDKNKMGNNFSFGAYNTQNIRLSVYGMAIKNKAGK